MYGDFSPSHRRRRDGLTENAGHENDGPKLTAGRKVAEAEIQFKRSYHCHEVCKYLNPKHCITLCIREYLFVEKNAIKCSEI